MRFAAVSIGAALLCSGIASASGVIRVHHTDGTIGTYPDSEIAIVGQTLRIRSADHEGTLIVQRAACSHQGSILMCLPTEVSLDQHGQTRPLALQTGTIYFNFTNDYQTLQYSSRQVPPHGILMLLRTERGTYINLDGIIDRGVKP